VAFLALFLVFKMLALGLAVFPLQT